MTEGTAVGERGVRGEASARAGVRVRATAPPGLRVLVVLGNAALHGQERATVEVLRAVRAAGADALFVTHAAWGHRQIQPLLDRLGLRWTAIPYARPFRKGIGLKGWARSFRHLLVGAWRFRSIIRSYRPTHVHVANSHYFLAVLPALLTTRTPVVFNLVDSPNRHHVLLRLLWRGLLIPRVTRFACISEFVRGRLLAAGAPPEKVRVIHGHPLERPDPPEPFAVEPFDGRTVAYVGQVTPHKGVDLLVEAALRLCRERDDVRVLIAGAPQTPQAVAYVTGLALSVQRAGLSERVRFLGYVEDVDGLLRAADVHACPSVWEEPFGLVVPEAKRAGVPSVVFPSGGLRELVDDGVDGVVCAAKTAEALEAGLRRYLDADAAELARAKAASRASLERLGITEAAFTRAWVETYAETRRGR